MLQSRNAWYDWRPVGVRAVLLLYIKKRQTDARGPSSHAGSQCAGDKHFEFMSAWKIKEWQSGAFYGLRENKTRMETVSVPDVTY